jgi:hypothetical protein
MVSTIFLGGGYSSIALNYLKNLVKIYKIISFSPKINYEIASHRFIYFIAHSTYFITNRFLNNYLKFNTKFKSILKIKTIKKLKLDRKGPVHILNEKAHIVFNLIIKKKVYIAFKKINFFKAFNISYHFSLKKNLKNELSIAFLTTKQILYFIQSINDEIILSGRLKFSNKKKIFRDVKFNKNLSKKNLYCEILIKFKESKKSRNYHKLFSIIFHHIFPYFGFINLSETTIQFFCFRAKERDFVRKYQVCSLKSKGFNTFILTNAFYFVEIN